MEMSGLIDVLIGVIIAGGGYWLRTMQVEQKRLEILLNRTREDYATKYELRDDMDKVMQALHRVEDKLDRLITEK
jgi:uncharacterized membrane protein YccC